MIFSVPRDGQLDLLMAIFRRLCIVMVRIFRVRVDVNVSVQSVRVRVRLKIRVSVNRVNVRMGMENSACHVYLSDLDRK